jgi:hypothetical protein
MGADIDVFRDVAVVVGAVFAAGYTRHLFPASPERNVLLVRYTPEGALVWNRTWTASYDEAAYGLTASSDALYLAGVTASSDSDGDGLLMKLDLLTGNVLWNATWGGAGADWFSRVATGTDGIYVVGCTNSYGAGESDALLVKFDFSGNQLWNATWGKEKADSGYGLAVADDAIYVTGQASAAASGKANATLIRFSLFGLQVWNATWRAGSQDAGIAVAAADSTIYVTGWARNSSGDDRVTLPLLKFSSAGDLLWNRTFSTGPLSDDLGHAIVSLSNSVYVAGDCQESPAAPVRSGLLCFNPNGTQVWSRTWGGAKDCSANALAAAVDGLYLAGATDSWLVGKGDGTLVKWHYDGAGPPGPVELSVPGDIDHDGTIPVSWSRASDPDGAIAEYELQMNAYPDFEGSGTNWTTASTSFLVESLNDGRYYFRVRARDDAGVYGPWSNTQVVTVTFLPTPLNPWLAPLTLALGGGLMATIVIILAIARRRSETSEASDAVLLLPLTF